MKYVDVSPSVTQNDEFRMKFIDRGVVTYIIQYSFVKRMSA